MNKQSVIALIVFALAIMFLSGVAWLTGSELHEILAVVSFYLICKYFVESSIDE